MSKIMNLVMDLQDYGILVPEIHNDQEPDLSDITDYQLAMMKDWDYKAEMDKLTILMIKDIGGE